MSLENIKAAIRQKITAESGISAKILFDFKEDGAVFVDTTTTPASIEEEKKDADVTLICSLETGEKILSGTQDPNIAFMMGKLKIKGSMGLAMKLNALLED